MRPAHHWATFSFDGRAVLPPTAEGKEVGVRKLLAGLVAVVAFSALSMSPASAGRVDPPGRQGNNCVHPFSGVSLNELFDVPEQFVGPICTGLTAGEHWRAIISYFGAETADAVYPPGYVPLHANPIDDVLAKTTIKVVIDGGTRQEKAYTFVPSDEAFRLDVRIHDLNPAFPDIPSFFVIPRMAPLSPGHHTHELIWILSAQHCDGTSTDEAEACFAGEYPVFVRTTDVAIPEPVNG
jgi:hypothetical protein